MEKYTIIYPPIISWNDKIFQRPHQLLAEFARQGHFSILANLTDDKRGLYWFPMDRLCISNRLEETLQNPDIQKKVKGTTTVFWNSWPKIFRLKDKIKPDIHVFDYIDEASEEFYHWQEGLVESISSADLVVCSSNRLFNLVSEQYPEKRIRIVKNGADIRPYLVRSPPIPDELAELKQRYSCIVGFHGSLQSWVDYRLIAGIADKRPDWGIVLVGPEYCPADVCKKKANVHLLGFKPYKELYQYVTHFDVGIIPFQVRQLTHSSNPIKMYEYLAAGVPVVATPIQECVQYQPYIRIAGSADDFIVKIEEARNVGEQEKRNYRIVARKNSWEERVHSILKELKAIQK